jgi:hypothetical protein
MVSRTVQSDLPRHEDCAPVEMLASLFEARGWTYDFVSDDEITGEVQGSWASYQLRGSGAEDNVLQLLCLPDIRVPDDKKQAMFEVVALINEQMWLGHFDVVDQCGAALSPWADAGRRWSDQPGAGSGVGRGGGGRV